MGKTAVCGCAPFCYGFVPFNIVRSIHIADLHINDALHRIVGHKNHGEWADVKLDRMT
ncbi:MAG: hypothetical protein GTN81_16115 [Proteobacteria bacterium]|nr:hypothetical protein [Pseudomonadota bacterium]